MLKDLLNKIPVTLCCLHNINVQIFVCCSLLLDVYYYRCRFQSWIQFDCPMRKWNFIETYLYRAKTLFTFFSFLAVESFKPKPAPRRALKKLLDRIRSQRSQRSQWTDHSSHVPAADSPTAIMDQIPERDTTIDTGSLTSEEKDKLPPLQLLQPSHSPPGKLFTYHSFLFIDVFKKLPKFFGCVCPVIIRYEAVYWPLMGSVKGYCRQM